MSEPTKPPWEQAMYLQVQKLEGQLQICKAERARLQARVADLSHRNENWQLRRQAWARERAELLGRLKEFSK